ALAREAAAEHDETGTDALALDARHFAPGMRHRIALAIDDRDLAKLEVRVVVAQRTQRHGRRRTHGERIHRQAIIALERYVLRERRADVRSHRAVAVRAERHGAAGNSDTEAARLRAPRNDAVTHETPCPNMALAASRNSVRSMRRSAGTR